jgi:hypothetical protein
LDLGSEETKNAFRAATSDTRLTSHDVNVHDGEICFSPLELIRMIMLTGFQPEDTFLPIMSVVKGDYSYAES